MTLNPRLSIGAEWGNSETEPILMALDEVRPIVQLETGAPPALARAAVSLGSMLLRVFPHTVLMGDAELGQNPWNSRTAFQAISSMVASRPTATRDPVRDFVFGVGPGVEKADLWIGGGEWTARLGTSPQQVSSCEIGLGLQAASAQAAGELTKWILGPLGMINLPIGSDLVWNLIDFRLTEREVVVDRMEPVDIVLFGAGSVGSSTAGLLVMTPTLSGRINAVDPDTFDPERNPYRYPALIGTETGSKAEWVADALAQSGWQSAASVSTVGDWVSAQSNPGIHGIAISSVDSLDGRLEVADALARTTITLGVAGLALHIQREHLGDGFACPFCQYVDLSPSISQIQVWATLTGISPERVAELHFSKQMLIEADVQLASAAGRLRPNSCREMIGRRLEDLIHRAYAEATVQLPSGAAADVSAPFVSWMAGVLGAAEIVKSASGLAMVDRRFDLDMSGVPLGIVRRRQADSSGRCVCGPGLRSRWMAKLYGGPWNSATQNLSIASG